jgi:hypothetical protein
MTALRRVLSRLRPAAKKPAAARPPAATGLLHRFLQPAYDLRDWRLLSAARDLVRLPVPPALRPVPVRARGTRSARA